MIVNLEDGCCRTCGGQLEILEVDDCSMTVTCTECADSYDLEPDGLNDACMTYFFPLRVKQLLGEEQDHDA